MIIIESMKDSWQSLAVKRAELLSNEPGQDDPLFDRWKYQLGQIDLALRAIERERNIAIRTKNGKGYSKAAKEAMGISGEEPDNVPRLKAIAISNGLLVTRMRTRLQSIAALAGVNSEAGLLAIQTMGEYLS